MTYEQALEWLFARTRNGAKRELGRVRELLEQLAYPERKFDALHVIGTNGKGSVCAMLVAGLVAGGGRIGMFTSPHLNDFCERIRIDGQEIEQAKVIEFVCWAQTQGLQAAFFDLTVGLAFAHFARSNVNFAVIEAGVGGALDATNTLERVKLTVITNVDLDHVATIGPGLHEIALEKAGAIRPGVPVVTAAKAEALELIRAVAAERNAPLHVLGADPIFGLPNPPRLQGTHQLENAALAVAALRLLGQTETQVHQALRATWPGRFETLLWQGTRFVLDGAHNPAAARALAEVLESGPGYALVFGAFERKAVKETLRPLQQAQRVIFVAPGPLAADPVQLAQAHHGETAESLEQALRMLVTEAVVVVTGSLYLVGAARAWLLAQGAHAPASSDAEVDETR